MGLIDETDKGDANGKIYQRWRFAARHGKWVLFRFWLPGNLVLIMSHNELDLHSIAQRLNRATPGPWFVRGLDDQNAMNLTAISTQLDTGKHERWPDFDHREIIAATLVQAPRYVDVGDEKWDENADFIAHARTDVEDLLREVEILRARIRELERS